MSDSDEKLSGKERSDFLRRVAKNPIPTLRSNIAKGKTCGESIDFLRQIRAELGTFLTQDPARKISAVHPAFKQFYVHGDGEVKHHIGLFSILKDAGFSRNEIESTLMDNMPLGTKSTDPQKSGTKYVDRSGAVREYLALTQSALDKVFAAEH